MFREPAANAWFHMNNSNDSMFLVPQQEKHYVGWKQAADVFCKKQNKLSRKSESMLGTQKGVNSRFISFEVSLKMFKLEYFSMQ